LLDVGGGSGTFIRAAGSRAPKLNLMVFDLPQVAEAAKRRLDTPDLAGRLTVTGGDFLSGSLPKGADLISLIRVLHDHDDDRALTLLKAIREALPADGALLIAEPMSGTPGAEPIGDAYFGFYLLAMRSGRPRTPAEIGDILTAAGFSTWRLIPSSTPLLARLILARP
jgi:demethylspheroidene O-methyltransferase